MSNGALVVVVLTVLVTIGLVAWMVANRHHPEVASGHSDAPGGWQRRPTTLAHHGGVDDRPAGPGAEADGVAGRGQPVPGPSADSLEQPAADP